MPSLRSIRRRVRRRGTNSWFFIAGGVTLASLIGIGLYLLIKGELGAPTIGDILERPDRFIDEGVEVEATVREAIFVPGLGASFLLLGDGESEIWYREGGDRAARVGEEILVQAIPQRGVNIPTVGVVAVALVHFDLTGDILSQPASFLNREITVRGTAMETRGPSGSRQVCTLVDDASGQIWACGSAIRARQENGVTVEGVIAPDLCMVDAGLSGVGIIGYEQIAGITDAPHDFSDSMLAVKGTVHSTFAVPFTEYVFLQVDDGTDQIWCRTEQQNIHEGDLTIVRGEVQEGIELPWGTYGTTLIERAEMDCPR